MFWLGYPTRKTTAAQQTAPPPPFPSPVHVLHGRIAGVLQGRPRELWQKSFGWKNKKKTEKNAQIQCFYPRKTMLFRCFCPWFFDFLWELFWIPANSGPYIHGSEFCRCFVFSGAKLVHLLLSHSCPMVLAGFPPPHALLFLAIIQLHMLGSRLDGVHQLNRLKVIGRWSGKPTNQPDLQTTASFHASCSLLGSQTTLVAFVHCLNMSTDRRCQVRSVFKEEKNPKRKNINLLQLA